MTSPTNPDEIPGGTLERIEAFRSHGSGWYDNHQGGISDAVADKAIWLARLVGPELVFAVPFDGAIVLTRRWTWGHHPHGRSVEIQPDGLMSLVADHPLEDGVDADHDQPFDVRKAVAWLLADTRTGNAANISDEAGSPAREPVARLLGSASGLIVITGPTGSGKSTLIAERGAGSPERPLPSMEHAAAAVSDAEARRLVLGTMYTPDPLATIERLVLMVPESHQERWRLRLADALAGIVCTRLHWTGADSVPTSRVAVPEITVVPWTPQLADTLRADDWAEQLRKALGET